MGKMPQTSFPLRNDKKLLLLANLNPAAAAASTAISTCPQLIVQVYYMVLFLWHLHSYVFWNLLK